MQSVYAVVTAMGRDRVGIVDDIATALDERGCNIEESRMALLGGEFAVIMLVTCGQEALEKLREQVSELGDRLSLQFSVRDTNPPAPQGSGRPYRIESVSLDAPGIVHAVAELLRRYGISVEDMETETAAAPWTGAPMFRMRAQIVIPAGVSVSDLRRDLLEIERERDLDITLRPA